MEAVLGFLSPELQQTSFLPQMKGGKIQHHHFWNHDMWVALKLGGGDGSEPSTRFHPRSADHRCITRGDAATLGIPPDALETRTASGVSAAYAVFI